MGSLSSFENKVGTGSKTPCTACSWTPFLQNACSYDSNVKLIEGASDQGVWSIGSKLILKERGNRCANGIETRNIRFLKENTSIPVPTILTEWREDNGHYFSIEERLPGKPLNEVWSAMTDDDKAQVAKQTADYLQQLHELRSSCIQNVGGGPVYSAFLFGGDLAVPHGPISSDGELWNELKKQLNDIPKNVCHSLGWKMPTAAPYKFTHCDLAMSCIMVEAGNVTGIVEWQFSGYFPSWWEAASCRLCADAEDKEWKGLLLQYMPRHPAAEEFYLDLHCLSSPSMSTRKRQLLEDLNLMYDKLRNGVCD